MLHRLKSAVGSRMLQAYQIASWHRPNLYVKVSDCADVRRRCPCLFTTLNGAIKIMPPQSFGILISLVRKCVITLAIFIVQDPTSTQLGPFIAELRRMISTRFPDPGICDGCLSQMAAHIRTEMIQQGEVDPAYIAALGELREMRRLGQICEAERLNRKVTTRINLAIFQVLLPILHEEFGFRDIIAFSRAYRQEDRHHFSEPPLPLIHPIEFSVDDVEAQYETETVSERVELSTFCKPVGSITEGTECSICITVIDLSDPRKDEQPVMTKCGHVFHTSCLDKWVNDSAMNASNTCPSCRKVLCEARRRQQAYVGNEDGMTADGSSTWSAESAVAMSSRAQIEWIEARIAAHQGIAVHQLEQDWSDTDDSSFSASDFDGHLSPQELFEVIRSEHIAHMRILPG